MPTEVNLENLNVNDEFEQHISMQYAKALQQKYEEEKQLMVQDAELEPPERVRRFLFNLVIESTPLSTDDMSFILTQLENLEAR